MTLDELLAQPVSWLGAADEAGIAISCRVRLARNVGRAAFPGWAGEEESARLSARLRDVLLRAAPMRGGFAFEMSDLTPLDRLVLRERHLISTELAEKGRGSCVVVSPSERLAVMVNEEDHLRLQGMGPGLDVGAMWRAVDELDSVLEEEMEFAFDSSLGYLTACPSNVGTGLRASVMLHLPGLRAMGEIEAVVRGLSKIGLAVRGLLGEGTEASGNMYQISNQITLGEAESAIVARLAGIVAEVREHEVNARGRLQESRGRQLRDRVGRAFGLLMHAELLSSEEALDLLSALRLGVAVGLVRNLSPGDVDRMFLAVQPAHLQRGLGRLLSAEERDQARAELVRGNLGRVALAV